MAIIDAFIHPTREVDETALMDLTDFPWDSWFEATLAEMDDHGIEASGICIMDPGILRRKKDLQSLHRWGGTGRFWFTLMPSLESASSDQILRATDSGFTGITFHSYLQRITEEKMTFAVALAMEAAQQGMFVGGCTAYGSKKIFRYRNLPLIAKIAERVDCPVILYHAGGSRILEALLICEMWANLYIETSFSLSYWQGSSVETDLAFAIRKLGSDRFLFGSDAPFVNFGKAIEDHHHFFRRFGFEEKDANNIMYETATNILGNQGPR